MIPDTNSPYARILVIRLPDTQDMSLYDLKLFDTALDITLQINDNDFLHRYFKEMYRYSLKEINHIIRYLNDGVPHYMKLKGISNKSKAKKISAITMIIANMKIDPVLVLNFEKMFTNIYLSGRGGSWGDNAFMMDFQKYEQAFTQRYPTE